MSNPRPTWLSQRDREAMDGMALALRARGKTSLAEVLERQVTAWDTAPADAAEAAAKAIYESEVDPGVTWENARARTHDECTGMARAVLRALGMPADA